MYRLLFILAWTTLALIVLVVTFQTVIQWITWFDARHVMSHPDQFLQDTIIWTLLTLTGWSALLFTYTNRPTKNDS